MTATVVSPRCLVRAEAGPAAPALSAVPVGDSPVLGLVLSAALDGIPAVSRTASGAADGVLIAFECPAGGEPLPGVTDWLGGGLLHGRPVGMMAVGDDTERSARALAWLRDAVRGDGGLPVGTGISMDAAQFTAVGAGWEFADITLPARLALLGCRVRTLARSRRILRGA